MNRCIIGLLLCLLFCSPAIAGEGIAIVKLVQGDVTIKRSGEISSIKQSDKLQAGDILMTGGNSQVGVIFHDGSAISLEENSFLNVKEFIFKPIENEFEFNLYLEKGAALFESGKIGKLSPESFTFEIPGGTIGIRGTKFLVEVR
ncbi:MAG: FecR domain-containing protein [Deltaproteobacteria bacterium]|nr:FecR domain-containing protein [Deltaproteobacteria bacterium]